MGTGHYRKPGAVEYLIDRRGGCHLGRLQLASAHRTRGGDGDDLSSTPGPALPGRSRPLAGDRDDGVDIGAAIGEELVLKYLGGEVGHDQLPLRILASRFSMPGVQTPPAKTSDTCQRYGDIVFAAPAIGPVNESHCEAKRIGVRRVQIGKK